MLLHYVCNRIGPVAEWLGKALQKLLQRFESARDLKTYKTNPFVGFFNLRNMKYSQSIGVVAALLLISVCFLPWIIIPNTNTIINGLNGFVNDKFTFGTQIKPHAFFAVIACILFYLKSLWAKRVNIFVCFLNISWAIKNFILLSMCRPECPTVQPGLYFLVFFAAVMLLMSFLPKIKIQP